MRGDATSSSPRSWEQHPGNATLCSNVESQGEGRRGPPVECVVHELEPGLCESSETEELGWQVGIHTWNSSPPVLAPMRLPSSLKEKTLSSSLCAWLASAPTTLSTSLPAEARGEQGQQKVSDCQPKNTRRPASALHTDERSPAGCGILETEDAGICPSPRGSRRCGEDAIRNFFAVWNAGKFLI